MFDAAWSLDNPTDFYFLTTASMTNKTRLWQLSFTDLANPAILGNGYYLLDVQVHKGNPDLELGEEGQLLSMYVPNNIKDWSACAAWEPIARAIGSHAVLAV